MTNPASFSRSVALSETGPVRSENQDSVLNDDELGLWLVADGMGGHAGGAVASRLARDAIREEVAGGATLREAILTAHQTILAAQQDEPAYRDMGTTVVAVHEHNGAGRVCWVGDSRAYRFRRETGELVQISRDHNLAGLLAAEGKITSGEVHTHPQRHVLTECLGQARAQPPKIECEPLAWSQGDWMLLCSDGLTGELPDDRITGLLAGNMDLASAGRALLDTALEAGGRDNVSVVLVSTAAGSAARQSAGGTSGPKSKES